MELYSSNKDYKLYHGNMLDMLGVIEPNTIDSIITDPPYELNFMNKGWDNSGIAFQPSTWQKCYEVLKSGGYLLAFGGTRTFHRIACAIEDAGFEIRDTIMWLYGSGFPKSMNIGLMLDKKNGVESKVVGTTETHDIRKNNYISEYKTFTREIKEAQNEWKGWGTALKPSYEPIIVARKPFKGSLVDNVIEWGVGGINIDECRVGNEHFEIKDGSYDNNENQSCFGNIKRTPKEYNGRFPANTILTYDETDFDEVCGGFPINKSVRSNRGGSHNSKNDVYSGFLKHDDFNGYECGYDDSGSASRYFMNCKYTGKDEEFRRYIYTPKASKKDRDEGLDNFEEKYIPLNNQATAELKRGNVDFKGNSAFCKIQIKKNTHPTVKPTELMQYLVRLVTPNNGVILDPFNGSGSTGKAVMYENKERNKNYKYIGIELTEEYLPISKARIECLVDTKEEPKEDIPTGQTSIFDFIGGNND